MKTSLPPKSKTHKGIIGEIVETIKEVGKKKISHIILFGSFARGNWINELKEESDGTLLDYVSDYDFLVITKQYDVGTGSNAVNLEIKINEKIDKKLPEIEHPASIIIEPLTRVNKDLRRGQYFFSDIKKEGILLYTDESAEDLSEAKELSNAEKKEISQEFYDYWMKSSEEFLQLHDDAMNNKFYNKAAFLLHQATESLYQCAHLVFTNYRPRLHDLEKLNKPLIFHSKKFLDIFPQNTAEEKECFDLLKRAYVESRYNKNYSITKEQLEYLVKRVEELIKLVKKVCLEKIESFK